MNAGAIPIAHLQDRFTAWFAGLTGAAILLVILWLAGPFALAGVVGGLVVLLTMLRFPWIGVLLLVASVPAQDFGAISFGSQVLTVTRAMFPLAVSGYLISIVIRRDQLAGTRLAFPLVAFVGIVVASITWAGSVSSAGAEAGRWLVALVAFLVLTHFLANSSQRRIAAFVIVMAVGGVFQATYGVTQSVLALGPESFRVGGQGSRAFGTFGQPNSYAGYLEMVFFPIFWLAVYFTIRLIPQLREYVAIRREGLLTSSPQRHEIVLSLFLVLFLGASALLILSGIAASFSRGAWLGIAAGGIATALLFHGWVRRGALLAAPLVILIALGGGSTVLPDAFSERAASGIADLRPFDAGSIPITDDNFAAAERMAHWQAGWRMFADQPASGVGAGNFNAEYANYFVREEFRFSRGHAHNFYIHVLAELGLPGLIFYLATVTAFVAIALRVVFCAPWGFPRMLALGALGTMVSVGVHHVFENLHVLSLSIQLAAVWALAVAAHRMWTAEKALDMEITG